MTVYTEEDVRRILIVALARARAGDWPGSPARTLPAPFGALFADLHMQEAGALDFCAEVARTATNATRGGDGGK